MADTSSFKSDVKAIDVHCQLDRKLFFAIYEKEKFYNAEFAEQRGSQTMSDGVCISSDGNEEEATLELLN